MYIVIAQNGEKAATVAPSLLENEAQMQKYLQDNLSSLPWTEIEPDLKLLQLGREFRTRAGRGERTDLLAIDAVGNFYIVETKLERNTDKRTVIAQALDYGASIWSRFIDPRELTDELDARFSLKEKARAHFELDEEALIDLIQRFETTVREGRIRFVVVMDAVDEDLKDLVRFINRNSNFKVYLVDLVFFKHRDIEVVVPTMHGVEAAKLGGSSAGASARANVTPEAFALQIPEEIQGEDRELLIRIAHVTISQTRHRSSPSGFFAQTRSANPVELYYLTPKGQIRFRLPGPGSSDVERVVLERWRRALTEAGLNVAKAPEDRGKGWSQQLFEWKPHAEKLIVAITQTANEM